GAECPGSSFVVVRLFFFFQAEDGIRDATVTGVQTCALPICRDRQRFGRFQSLDDGAEINRLWMESFVFCDLGAIQHFKSVALERSEERRVGKECGSRWSGGR